MMKELTVLLNLCAFTMLGIVVYRASGEVPIWLTVAQSFAALFFACFAIWVAVGSSRSLFALLWVNRIFAVSVIGYGFHFLRMLKRSNRRSN